MTVGATSAAVTGAVLALPFALLFTLLTLGIEPPLGPLTPLVTVDTEQPNVVGTAIVLGAWALAVVAFAVNLLPIVRDARAGRPVMTHPVNVALAIIILGLIVSFVVAIVVDQYPCWTGIPNCD